MDVRRGTLYRLLESLDENNEQLGWNMYRNNRGRIIVKICYDDETNLDLNSETTEYSHQTVSFKRKSTKEIKRNHLRAQNFRKKKYYSFKTQHVQLINPFYFNGTW